MPNYPRKPGPESTLAQTKTQLIDAAIDLLRERGIDVGLSHIPLSDTIARAAVTRSTAYRSLADDELTPQSVLHREILLYLLTRYTRGATVDAIALDITAELDRHSAALASGDVESRTRAMRGVIRVGANRSYDALRQSPERATLTAVYGALQSSSEVDWRHDAVSEGERGLNESFDQLYDGLVQLFDYRVKAPYTTLQFTAAAASLVEGIAMRHGFNDQVTMIDRPTGPDGANEPWSLFAVAFESMFSGMFEPANCDDPFADLLNY